MTFTFADLFSGCGGLGSGFQDSGAYQEIISMDSWKAAEVVQKANSATSQFEVGDLSDSSVRDSVASRLRGHCDVLLGGPPCQGFSTLGKRRDDDQRSTLVDVFAEVVLAAAPRIIIMENVRGITTKKHPTGMTYSGYLTRKLSGDYALQSVLIDCLEYGLAQTRVRWVLIGVNRNLVGADHLLSKIFTSLAKQKSKKRVSLRDIIGDLPHIEAGEGAEVIEQRTRGQNRTIYNHRAMEHGQALVERLSHVPPGGGLLDVPRNLLTDHLRKMVAGSYGSGGHVKNIYGRLEWNKPSGTIVAGMDKITCGRFVHPEADRLLTPRECARLQSFPDTFRFFGSLVNQYYMIGNAVPPRISTVLARASLDVLKKSALKGVGQFSDQRLIA